MEEKMLPLVVLTGPTAAGKTSLSLSLAGKINGQIISADSMQIYRYMDIGTAKIKPEEMRGIRHYLIDELDPDEEFNAAIFARMAKAAMEEIWANQMIPIVVGGSGFYIQALVNDIDFGQEDDPDCRGRLEQIAREQGPQILYQRLLEVDPASAKNIHPNNVKRVIRALEFYEQTGTRISEHNEEQKKKTSPYRYACFVLTMPRPLLYERIDRRVDEMMRDGLTQEVRGLLDRGYSPELVSMQGLGYKEFLPYFQGEISLEEAVRVLKRDTRHFAKRQLTWFRHREDSIWIDKSEFPDEEAVLAYMLMILKDLGISGM